MTGDNLKLNFYFLGNMHNINYFYMRENITLSHVDNFIFQNSHINELMFENANIKSADFALNGIYANKIEIISTTWHTIKASNHKTIIPQKVEHFHITNSTFNRVIPGLLYNFSNVIIDTSKIHHFASIPTYICINYNFTVRNSRIFQWHSHAISQNSKFNRFTIESSQIDKVHSRSIYETVFESIFIYKSVFLSTTKKFMDNIKTDNFILDGNIFRIFAANTFENSIFKNFILNKNNFEKIEPKAFANIVAERLQITNCKFLNFPQYFFENSNVSLFFYNDIFKL